MPRAFAASMASKITAAGSAFGGTMKATGIAGELAGLFPQTGEALLIVAFFLTMLVRMAQGSATVSMITSIGIIAPLLSQIELSYHPVYLALAIGCGSKPGPWMNDSGFWVISKMSGMTEGETLKTFSVMLTVSLLLALSAHADPSEAPNTAPPQTACSSDPSLPLVELPLAEIPQVITQAKGCVLVFELYASWCAPCLTALPLVDEMSRQFDGEDFQVVAVNVDRDPDQARRFLERVGVGYPSATDPEGRIPERFEIRTMPH